MKKKQVKKDKITGLRFDPGWLYTGVYRGKRVLLQVYGCRRRRRRLASCREGEWS